MSRRTLFLIGAAGLAAWWALSKRGVTVSVGAPPEPAPVPYRPEPWALGFAHWKGVQENPQELVRDRRAIGSLDGTSRLDSDLYRV